MNRAWIILILLLAFGFRLAVFDHGLPYIDNPDEPNFHILANYLRGERESTWRSNFLAGYPPGYIWFHTLSLELIDATSNLSIHTDMGTYIAIMRILSLLADMISLSILINLTKWLGSNLAALFTASLYAFSPHFIQIASDALPDPISVLLCLSAIRIGIHAIHTNKQSLAFLSLVLGLLTIIFKYTFFPVLIPVAIFFLLQLWENRLKAIPSLSLAIILIIPTAYYLLFIYGAISMNTSEALQTRGSFFTKMLDFSQWFISLNTFVSLLGFASIFLALIALTPFLRQKHSKKSLLLLLLSICGFSLLLLIPGYLAKYQFPRRYVWPSAALLMPALGIIFANFAKSWSNRRLAIATSLIPAIIWIPSLTQAINLANVTPSYLIMQRWFEENVPDNSRIWVEDNPTAISLDRYEKAYSGFRTFQIFRSNELPAWTGPIETIDYVYLRQEDIPWWPTHPIWPSLEELTLIKQVNGNPNLYVYSPDPLANQQETLFHNQEDDLLLRGIGLSYEDRIVSIVSYWQALNLPPTRDYSYALYLSPSAVHPSEEIIAQADGALGQRPTSTWNDSEEILRGEISPFLLDSTIQAGNYDLWLAIYYWESSEKLLLPNGDNLLFLGTIFVTDEP